MASTANPVDQPVLLIPLEPLATEPGLERIPVETIRGRTEPVDRPEYREARRRPMPHAREEQREEQQPVSDLLGPRGETARRQLYTKS